jgi:hypothetical protein
MSTNSFVAKPDADKGWVGRYVHYDGNPLDTGSQLFAIVARDGVDFARTTLITDHSYWSGLDSALSEGEFSGAISPSKNYQIDGVIEKRWDKEASYVAGYGEADLNECDIITPDTVAEWSSLQWGYVLEETGLTVYKVNSEYVEAQESGPTQDLTLLGTISWQLTPEAAQDMLENFECSPQEANEKTPTL